jgi:hypothetical protein
MRPDTHRLPAEGIRRMARGGGRAHDEERHAAQKRVVPISVVIHGALALLDGTDTWPRLCSVAIACVKFRSFPWPADRDN